METKKQPNKEKRQPKEEEEEDDDDDDSLKVTTSLDDAAEKILKHSFAIYKICNLDMQSKIQVAYDEAITILDYNDDDHGGGGGDDNTDENEALMLPSTMTQSSPSPRHERLLLKEYQKIHHGHLLGFNVPSPSKRLFRCYCNTPIENYQQKAENLKEKGEVKGEDDYFHHQQPWPSKSFQVASENLGNVLHHILMKCYQHILKKVLTEEEEDNNNINNNDDDDDDDDDDTNCSKAVLEKKAENDDGHHGRGDNKEHHPDRLVDEPSSKRLKRRRKGVATEEETEKKEGDEEEGAEWQMEKNWKRQSVRLQQTPLQSVTPAAAEINISNNCPLDYFFYHNNNNNTNADYPNCTIHTDRGLLICVCLSNTVPGLEVRSLTNKQFYCPEEQQLLLMMMRNEVRSRREGDDEMNTSNNNNNNNSNKSNHPMSNGWICIMAGDQLSSQLQKKSSSPSPSMNTTNNNNNNTNINSRSISCIHRVRDNLIGPRLSISYELRDTSG